MAVTKNNCHSKGPLPEMTVTEYGRYPKDPLKRLVFKVNFSRNGYFSHKTAIQFFDRFSMRMTLFNPSNNMKTLLFRHVRASRYHVIILKSRDINGSCSSPILHYLILNENILSFEFSFSSVHGLTWIFISTL